MRRVLPHVIALLLGTGAALLVACGSGGTKGGIPAASAGELKDQLETVRRAVADKRCDVVSGELRQVDDDISSLPGTVDKRLRTSLGDAADRLRQTAKDECKTETTQTQTVETQTRPPETQTQTLPPQTQTTPPATTTTPPLPQPPATTTTPPVTPPPPPAEPPAPVPVPPPSPGSGGSGGGATPTVPVP